MKKYLINFILSILITLSLPTISAVAQIPTIQDLIFYSSDLIHQNYDDNTVAACLRLDGSCVFRLAFPKSELTERINEVQYRLNNIKELYLQSEQETFSITLEPSNNLYDIYVQVENTNVRLLSVTQKDAEIRGLTLKNTAESMINKLEASLLKAKAERKNKFIIRQGIISLITLVVTGAIFYKIKNWEQKVHQSKKELEPSNLSLYKSLLLRLDQQQQWHFKEIQYRLLQLTRLSVSVGACLYILSLFPQTRTIQLIIITAIRLPLRVIAIILTTYFCIRLIYGLMNRLGSELISSQLLTPKDNRRLQLRINTIFTVIKSIIAIVGITIGIVISLAAIGVNVAPLIAGAGIIGIAISFASQNLIKDAINGFLIIIEDQYAVGDVINVGSVAGLVENINLRITQIRDAEGRLITIPNSEVKIVANLSSQWSRADLSIPISYDTDVNAALELVEKVAYIMSQDDQWQEYILETPQVLGVENFSDRGTIIRVWIKTEPLKQWEVSREFRRRIKTAFDNAGMPIQPPQQQVWLNWQDNQNKPESVNES